MFLNYLGQAGVQKLAVEATHAGKNGEGPVVVQIGIRPSFVNKNNAALLLRVWSSPPSLDHVVQLGKELDKFRWGLLEGFIYEVVVACRLVVSQVSDHGVDLSNRKVLVKKAARILFR